MSFGQDVPDWRQGLLGQQMGLLNQNVGDLGFAGIPQAQAAPPGISQLLAQIPDAKGPARGRQDRRAISDYRNFGAPLPQSLAGRGYGGRGENR